tara:strand:- start:404 stop:973 length:570 start_codon:yes stop_codon:yes gene_type:complete
MNERAKKILLFWFKESTMDQKFSKNDEFDEIIRKRFYSDYEKAITNKYDNWQNKPKECLALIITLDQFSRNLFRNNINAFAMDNKACSLSYRVIRKKFINEFSNEEILFSLLPLIHSEKINDHDEFYKMFDIYFKNSPKYNEARKMNILHTKIIRKFGRYPYRNKVLGRESTEGEIEYLKNNHHKFFNI